MLTLEELDELQNYNKRPDVHIFMLYEKDEDEASGYSCFIQIVSNDEINVFDDYHIPQNYHIIILDNGVYCSYLKTLAYYYIDAEDLEMLNRYVKPPTIGFYIDDHSQQQLDAYELLRSIHAE